MAPFRRLPRLPSFFKIFLNRSVDHLPLPSGFVHKHMENNIPDNATLRSVNGGYSWRLKIKKDGDIYCFADGWKQVVEDTQLVFGDVLVFWLVGRSIFKLLIFGTDCCEKDFPPKIKLEHDHDHIHDEEDEDDDIDGDAGDPCFTMVLSKKQNLALRFPREFARLIRMKAGRTISMKNLEGKEWPVRLLSEGVHYTRYYLSKGWSEFRRDNDLCEGDACVFKYLRSEDKLCLAEVTKKRVPDAVEVLKRLRGRAAPVVVEQPAGKVLKRPRGRPSRAKVVVEEKVQYTEPDGNVPVAEVAHVLKRPRGRPPCVEKKVQSTEPEPPDGKAPVGEGLKRKRGRPRRVEVESKNGGVTVVKRPRGRPFKKKRGRPAGGSC
ncbi:unnamed protein product [Lactuca virosa]|uniref:TF-B3 domain-containing protein n=1 Tax=Lactuca virosa TaxID=75947 RepID=A0AAU9LRX3_9ASTR|nr:unnamed protein product [Lactuca virosa]